MLKISYAGCLRLSPAILSHFSVEMCAASKNCQKFTKNHFWGVQDRSRSSMLIKLKRLSPVLVMINRMSVRICNCFHATLANSGTSNFSKPHVTRDSSSPATLAIRVQHATK